MSVMRRIQGLRRVGLFYGGLRRHGGKGKVVGKDDGPGREAGMKWLSAVIALKWDGSRRHRKAESAVKE